MTIDPRTPVVVGAGQFLNRVDHGSEPRSPVELIIEATGRARSDAGVENLTERAQVVATTPMISWRYKDPGRLVADALGAHHAKTWYPAMGGNTPQLLLNKLACDISDGSLDTALLVGAEAWHTRATAKRADSRPEWESQGDSVVPDWGSEDTFTMGHPAEHAKGIVAPVQAYPLFETALIHEDLREHPGRTLAEQLDIVGEMWAGFSRVASQNPHAWNTRAFTAQEIIAATADNRYVGWPYTKRMVSFPTVDMASALIVMSAQAAQDAGVPQDRWVFLWSGTDGVDLVMSERESFIRSPSIGVGGHRALELAGVDLDGIDHLDVYSCFPSAVELFCREFDLDPLSRPLTVYGGLAFGGGPWNNPVGHALASMVRTLRESPGLGLVTANGGHVDKHAFGVLGSAPPPQGFRYERPQAAIDSAATPRKVLTDFEGTVDIETWTVMYDRDNRPERYHGSCLTADGDRVWATSTDPEIMATATSSDLGGHSAAVETDGTLHL
ncbi:MAG: hypothetical protein ACK5O2_09475 [Microthrixaceae bacterium]